MAGERGGPTLETVCPLHGGPRSDAAHDQAPAAEQVDWAGLPVNLDMVFSQQQRDKVYVQHLMRKRGTQLWRWLQNGGQPCSCGVDWEQGRRTPNTAQSISTR